MRTTGILRRLVLGAMAVAGVIVVGAQSGCDNDNIASPTAVAPPGPQPLQPAVSSARFILLVEPTNPDSSYPLAGEVLIDGQSVWSGAMGEPDPDTYYYVYYYGGIPFNVNEEVQGGLAPGGHTLTFRVTDQRRSPTRYTLSGRVDVSWNTGHVSRAATWSSVAVRLSTGKTWSIPFEVPTQPVR